MPVAHPQLQPFLDYLKFEKRYSRHTLVSYENDLTGFFDYLELQFGSLPLPEITHSFIRSWLASLKDAGMTAKTINRKISALRSFFKHCLKVGTLAQSPMAKVVAPKNEKRLPQFVADKDIRTLFDYVEFPDSFQGRTERLALELFYQTGMRLSELTGLKEGAVNAAGHSLKVLGKGNKERIIPIGDALLRSIEAYVAEKAGIEGADRTVLLVGGKGGKPLQPRAVYKFVHHYLTLSGSTIEKRSPHVLRHTFATHLTGAGAELNAVKELLGHSSLAATQVYTHNTIEKLKNIHKNFHPKA
ncbi:integrase [Flaviaesturariibacter flavus]|uniref:Integrase n=1 Tax=Flaviaesturariibacter flavus TaxID=2502780 RepID=A0A4R1BJQ1_9BACT|nr:tyrosine-type recombinase/integrase [Flaviaesturariibacter flavus]TCJ17625.1 integrase [Flaviaesturariibacter flavus]